MSHFNKSYGRDWENAPPRSEELLDILERLYSDMGETFYLHLVDNESFQNDTTLRAAEFALVRAGRLRVLWREPQHGRRMIGHFPAYGGTAEGLAESLAKYVAGETPPQQPLNVLRDVPFCPQCLALR